MQDGQDEDLDGIEGMEEQEMDFDDEDIGDQE